MRVRPPSTSRVAGIHYTVAGDTGPVVVLLHGFSDNLSTWHRVVPALAAGHRVIALDLPGFGRSTRAWTEPLLAGYVDVVSEVLDAEDVRTPVMLVGNSMGAAVATLFAARHPERTDRVVLVDMPGLGRVPRLWRLAMSRAAETSLRTTFRVVPAQTGIYGLGLAYTRIACADPRRLGPEVRRDFAAPLAAHGGLAGLLPIGRALVRELGGARLAEIVADSGTPTLVVFGGRDMLTPARAVRALGRANRTVVLPGCGHCPQLDDPSALLTEVLPFLRESAPATTKPQVLLAG